MFDLLHLFLSRKGRIGRGLYWATTIPLVILYFIAIWIYYIKSTLVGCILVMLCLYSSMMVNYKRCHDRNRSGIFSYLLVVPLINIWPAIELGFLGAHDDNNRFTNNIDGHAILEFVVLSIIEIMVLVILLFE